MKNKKTAKEFFNNRAEQYQRLSDWSVNDKVNNKSNEFLEKLSGSVALELGAGTGVLISKVKNFKSRIAFDISEKMLSKISDSTVEKIVGDVHEMKFPIGFADLIICRQLLHYCNLKIAFQNIKNVLSPSGFLHVVQVIEFKEVPEIWDQTWASFRKVENRKHLRTTELNKYFKEFAFEILRYETVILGFKYSWSEFFLKHSIDKNDEQKIISFFEETPKYIADAINLSLNESEISYNRIIGFWLLKNS